MESCDPDFGVDTVTGMDGRDVVSASVAGTCIVTGFWEERSGGGGSVVGAGESGAGSALRGESGTGGCTSLLSERLLAPKGISGISWTGGTSTWEVADGGGWSGTGEESCRGTSSA